MYGIIEFFGLGGLGFTLILLIFFVWYVNFELKERKDAIVTWNKELEDEVKPDILSLEMIENFKEYYDKSLRSLYMVVAVIIMLASGILGALL